MSNVEMKLTLQACLMSVYFDRHFCTFVSRNMERLWHSVISWKSEKSSHILVYRQM